MFSIIMYSLKLFMLLNFQNFILQLQCSTNFHPLSELRLNMIIYMVTINNKIEILYRQTILFESHFRMPFSHDSLTECPIKTITMLKDKFLKLF